MSLNRGPKGLSPCPVCLVPQDKQIFLGLKPQYPYREAAPVQALLDNTELTKRQLDEALKPMGLRPVEVCYVVSASIITFLTDCRMFSGNCPIAMSIGPSHGIDCMRIMVVFSLIICSRSSSKL